jgi:5-oxoprolinase (ATP-hydrolysing)
VFLNLCYEGTDTAMMIKDPDDGNYATAFVRQFRQEYGFELQKKAILISDVRVRGIGSTNILRPVVLNKAVGEPEAEKRSHKVYFGTGWHDTLVYMLEKLGYGHVISGPAVIMNGNSTIIVEPDCMAVITKFGNVHIKVGEGSGPPLAVQAKEASFKADVIQLSIFNNRFMGIAEQMGRTLQRTSISTNIKERLDFSCALFSPDGGLVANAPHVPVHLGAMSSTVRWQLAYWGKNLRKGDVLVTNHPATGGSHLPDITVITPVRA